MSSRVRRIEELEELDELTAAVTISDQGVHLARQQVDASKQASLPGRGRSSNATTMFVGIVSCIHTSHLL